MKIVNEESLGSELEPKQYSMFGAYTDTIFMRQRIAIDKSADEKQMLLSRTILTWPSVNGCNMKCYWEPNH